METLLVLTQQYGFNFLAPLWTVSKMKSSFVVGHQLTQPTVRTDESNLITTFRH